MLQKITRHVSYKNYVLASNRVYAYLNAGKNIPTAVDYDYRYAIYNYRIYLDSLDYKMPKQKFPYKPNEKNTWRYLDVRILSPKNMDNINVASVINPRYKYKR